MKESIRVLGLAGLLLVIAAASPHAQRSWSEARSPHFTVVTDGDGKTAQTIAWQFEQVRAAIQTYWPWADLELDRPFLALAVRNEMAMRQIVPQFWEPGSSVHPTAVSVSAPDRHYVALRTDVLSDDRQGSVNPYRDAYWSYSSIVIDTSLSRNLPLWLTRGLASVMSNIIVRDTSIQVGRILPSDLEQLRGGIRLRLDEFVSVDRKSPWYTQGEQLAVFDAQAALFVHYLLFGDEGTHREALDRFIKLMLDGGSAADSLRSAFKDLSALENGFGRYFQKQLFGFTRVNVDVNIKRDAAVRVLAPAESTVIRAAFHAAMRRPVEARALLDETRAADPRLASSYEVEGLLLEADRKFDEAKQAYERAQDSGSSSFYAKYRWAALAWGRPDIDQPTRARVQRSLEEATRLNSRFSPAYALLGEVTSRLATPNDGLPLVRRAIALEPDRMQNHLALARILWSATKRDEADREARLALTMASTDAERQAAQELIGFLEKNTAASAAAPAPAPAVRPASPLAADRAPAAAPGNQMLQQCLGGDAAACATVMPGAESACASGTAGACSFLGQVYGVGRGVPADPARAATFTSRACDNGSRLDCVNLAAMQAEGRGIPRDVTKATATVKQLCEEGLREGCTTWALMLLQKRTPEDLRQARDLLDTACSGGLSRACDILKSLPR